MSPKGDYLSWMILPFRRYADFKGRSCRKEYWMFQFIIWLSLGVYGILFSTILGLTGAGTVDSNFNPVIVIFIIPLIAGILISVIPGIALTVRRFHDQGKSGWFALLFMLLNAIPFIGWVFGIIFIAFMMIDGTVGDNEYGPDPKQR